MLEHADSPITTSLSRSRPKSIRIYKRRIIDPEYRPLNTIGVRNMQIPSYRSPKNADESLFENLISITTLNKFTQNTRNPTPVSNSGKEKIVSFDTPNIASDDNSPLFYPKEPRIHTTMSKKKRFETSKEPQMLVMKKVSWVLEFSKKNKWKSLSREHKLDLLGSKSRLQRLGYKGKLYKGLCERPRLLPSPVRIHNIKFA